MSNVSIVNAVTAITVKAITVIFYTNNFIKYIYEKT